MAVTIEDIQAARARIAAHVYRSPCPHSLLLSRLTGSQVFCKLDNLQVTGSFKERGARNRLALLPEALRRRGVIAVSAGNHALGLAYHGQGLGIPVTVVMPRWAPLVKVSTCASFGATVLLEGESFGEARERALALSKERGLTFISPYEDPEIIAGQGTLGLELAEDVADLDAVIVPVGGGGLITGIAVALKAVKPNVRIIGVEAESAPTMHAAIRAGRPEAIQPRPTLADGLAVVKAGDIAFAQAPALVDRFVLVDEARIAQAILRLLELEKLVVEGAGAVPLAALLAGGLGLEGKRVALVLAGGNIDVSMIARVIERGLAADGRLCRLTCRISDRPGGLARVVDAVAAAGASIKEVHHDRNFGPADVALVGLTMVLETRDRAHIAAVLTAVRATGVEASCEPA